MLSNSDSENTEDQKKKSDGLDIEYLRAHKMHDFLDDPDPENLHFGINWEKTRELQS